MDLRDRMKKLRFTGFALLAACVIVFGRMPFFAKGDDTKKLSDQLAIHLPMKVFDLSNGLRVVLVEDHTVPIVSYQTWYRVGSVDETLGMTGISHLFEHLMFKGTPKYGPKQFFLQLEAKGADVNAFTTRDYTVYHETFVPPLIAWPI
jgi:predicted Zn-dependent peptidase